MTVYVPEEAYTCEGVVAEDAGEPSPKFQVYAGLPVVVFVNETVKGLHPDVDEAPKLTTGAGFTEIVRVESSEQLAVDAVNTTEKFPAEPYT